MGSKSYKHSLILLLGLVVACITLLPRLDGGYFPGKYLWAEDGNIFINQARTLGLRSLWEPYAGYIHTYPRLIAFSGSFFDLEYQPYFLLSGWLFAFGTLISVIMASAIRLGVTVLRSCILVALVTLQPSYGEVFFNITNSQWMLGAALTIYIFSSPHTTRKFSFTECFFLVIACLTGPFSIFIAPLLILHGLIHKTTQNRPGLHVIVLVCSLIQASVLIDSNRLSPGALDPNIHNWLKSAGSLVSFGANSVGSLVAVSVFWASFVFVLVYTSGNRKDNTFSRSIALWLFVCATVNIIAALYSSKTDPMAIVAYGGGNRYTWIPYTLLYFGAIIASNESKKMQYSIISSIAAMSYLQFHPVPFKNLQYASYANFSKYQRVVIPIYPQWSYYPGWHIDGYGGKLDSHSIVQKDIVGDDTITSSGMTTNRDGGALKLSSWTNDPILVFDKPILCREATDIGVDIEISRSNDGWMQFFWGSSRGFTEANSLRQYYPAGKIKAQFAFPNNEQGVFVRLDPYEKEGEAEVEKFVVYCLP